MSAVIPVSAKIADPDLQAFVAAAATADPSPNLPEMDFVWSPWNDAMSLVAGGKEQPQQALDQAQLQVEALISGQQ